MKSVIKFGDGLKNGMVRFPLLCTLTSYFSPFSIKRIINFNPFTWKFLCSTSYSYIGFITATFASSSDNNSKLGIKNGINSIFIKSTTEIGGLKSLKIRVCCIKKWTRSFFNFFYYRFYGIYCTIKRFYIHFVI